MSSSRRFPQTYDVFVGNLPEDTDQKAVGKVFNRYGEIHAIIVRDSNQASTKIAYVKFLCEEDAKHAIEDGGKQEIDGRRLFVKRAEQRKRPGQVGGIGGLKQNVGGLSQKEPDLVSNLETASTSSRDMLEEIVQVCHTETPIAVFVQISSEQNLNDITTILQKLSDICPTAPKVSGPVEYNKVYGAKFCEDEQWYRCHVRQIYGPDKVKIQFMDYGNTEEIDPAKLVELPEELTSYSPFAQKIVLHNLRPKDINCSKGKAFLQELTLGKSFRAIFKRKLTDGSGYYAELFDDGESIIDKVLAEGYAIVRQVQKPLGGGTMDYTSGGYGDGFKNNNRSNNNTSIMTDRSRRDVEKITSERDMLNVELTNMKSKMKTLQSEFNTVSNKLLENRLSHLLKMVMMSTSKVKQIRCQFAGDDDTCLDNSIKLVLDTDKLTNIQIDTLQPVLSTLSTYRAAQKEISLCKDKNELEEMIKTRDTARIDLFDKLNMCVADLQKFPLQDRGVKVQACIENLEKNYKYFLSYSLPIISKLDDLIPAYEEWKVKKKEDFEECRKLTNEIKQSVLSSLLNFHSILSDENSDYNQQPDCDLDNQLKHYLSALHNEIDQSETEQIRDAPLLANIIQNVHTELRKESASIENYRQLMAEFQQTISDIKPWLNEQPNSTQLQSTRKTLRTLKSKLRHRLADKIDHEENEGEGKELDEIKTDLEEIRNEIHQILLQENEQIALIAKLAEEHFPEVLSEFSEFGIDNYLTYKGLVKDSYELDQFDLRSVLEGSIELYETTFNGQTVFIREFLLADGDRVNKEQFLNHAYNYRQINHDYLHSIDTVFFNKNGRRGYIKSPKSGELLVSVMESGIRPNSKAIQQIIRCISKSIEALHSKSYIHGDITPESILMKEDGNAILLEPDFSRSVNNRCRRKFQTKSGLEFVAPEIRNMCDVGPSVDLYNLGLLILWLHYPESNIGLLPDNVPDFTSLPLDQSTQMILRSLLSSIPHLRPTIELLLQSPYHTMDLPDNLITTPHYSPQPPSLVGMGGGDMYNMTSGHSNVMTTLAYPTCSIPPVYDYQTNIDRNGYMVQSSSGYTNYQPSSNNYAAPPPQPPAESNTYHPQQSSSSQSNEPFEIGTFDLEAAMSSIPDAIEEIQTDSNTDNLVFDPVIPAPAADQSNSTTDDQSNTTTDDPVAAELQKLSMAENANNSNIEAEKLMEETENEPSVTSELSQ